MPKRKICPHCGFINRPESEECDICGEDLSLVKQINVEKGLKERFFDKSSNSFVMERPGEASETTATQKEEVEKPIQKEEPAVEENVIEEPKQEEIKQESKPVDNSLVKICPSCHTENEKDAVTCSKCGVFLLFERPTTPMPKAKASEDVKEEFEVDDILLEEDKVDTYYLYIGKTGENCVQVQFDEHNDFCIGRHFQDCLVNAQYVSSYHCRIKRKDDQFYLYEPSDRPSSNGTYLRIVGDRKERIKPGHAYKIKNGTVFYIADVPCTFAKGL